MKGYYYVLVSLQKVRGFCTEGLTIVASTLLSIGAILTHVCIFKVFAKEGLENAVKNTPCRLIRRHLRLASTSLHREGASHIKTGAWSNAHLESGIP